MLAQRLLSQRQVDQPGFELQGYCCILKLTSISLSKTACIASTSLDLCVTVKQPFSLFGCKQVGKRAESSPNFGVAGEWKMPLMSRKSYGKVCAQATSKGKIKTSMSTYLLSFVLW